MGGEGSFLPSELHDTAEHRAIKAVKNDIDFFM
jgi:hypothetical protein